MRHAQRLTVAILWGLVTAAGLGAEERPPLERSVVRIFNYSQRGDWYSPWRFCTAARKLLRRRARS